MAKNIVDFLLKQRLDGEKALILDLKKQSKVGDIFMFSDLKYFIMYFQKHRHGY